MMERWLLRASRWARRPPSWRQLRMLLIILAIGLALVGIEHLWGWPDFLTVNGPMKLR
jgi:hypothetical protein